jgi:hypothetical protein
MDPTNSVVLKRDCCENWCHISKMIVGMAIDELSRTFSPCTTRYQGAVYSRPLTFMVELDTEVDETRHSSPSKIICLNVALKYLASLEKVAGYLQLQRMSSIGRMTWFWCYFGRLGACIILCRSCSCGCRR